MSKKNRPLTVKDYETLGKILENIIEYGYIDRGRLYRVSFLKGLITGFGGVIGATLVVGIVAWLLSLFDTIPWVGEIAEGLRNALQQQ